MMVLLTLRDFGAYTDHECSVAADCPAVLEVEIAGLFKVRVSFPGGVGCR